MEAFYLVELSLLAFIAMICIYSYLLKKHRERKGKSVDVRGAINSGSDTAVPILVNAKHLPFQDPTIPIPTKKIIKPLDEGKTVLRKISPTFNSVPHDLFEHACKLIEQRYSVQFPFVFRGITIRKIHLKAFMEILNAVPDKKLPQNCRNDIRKNTPDGLDLRIKEYLNSDLRTANILTDLFETVGITSNITVSNPETGRPVKGSRLNSSWCWDINDNKTGHSDIPSTPSVIKGELQTYRNSLARNPADPGTWRTYEAALLQLKAIDETEYLNEKRINDVFRNSLMNGSHEVYSSPSTFEKRQYYDYYDELPDWKESGFDGYD